MYFWWGINNIEEDNLEHKEDNLAFLSPELYLINIFWFLKHCHVLFFKKI